MSEKDTIPVFYTDNRRRWATFLGAIRIICVFVVFAVVTILLTIVHQSNSKLPSLTHQNELYKKVLDPKHTFVIQTQQNSEYQKLQNNVIPKSFQHRNHKRDLYRKGQKELRSAFYVNWDPQSLYSLKRNISKLDMVMPEWFSLSPQGDSLTLSVDQAALSIMREHSVHVLPIVNNYFDNHWDTSATKKMLSSAKSRSFFINSILKNLKKYGFSGVNIDIESLPISSDNDMIAFQRELYTTLHKDGLMVTQDIPVSPDIKLFEKLSAFNDYLVIMGYDLHWEHSLPGPIVRLEWVEDFLNKLGKNIPAEKCILGIPAYGYDWTDGKNGVDVSYEEAVTTAKESDGSIDFDESSNCHFTYGDDDDKPHDVWFADAITCFNLLRTSADFGLAGTVLWRLGGEDQRIWSFYFQDMSYDDQKTILPMISNSPSLTCIPSTGQIDFTGSGEILDNITTPDSGRVSLEIDTNDCIITDEIYKKLPSTYLVKKFGKADRKIVLTFDDGPSSVYTPEILKILHKKQVPATFFVIGINAENNLSILKKIYNSGFEIGNHTFTHPNIATVTPERTRIELNATRRIIECVTGHSTILFRPPYNADSEPQTAEEIIPVSEARKFSYYTIGESIDPCDWEKGIPSDTIIARIIASKNNGNIILLHDGGGDRSATVDALPKVIDYFRNNGYSFTTVADLVGKTRDDVMPPIANTKDRIATHVNWTVAVSIYWIEKTLLALFLVSVILSIGRTLIIAVIAAIQKRKQSKSDNFVNENFLPRVSVIVPAYNEEITAPKTIENLLLSEYKSYEIIFVDDGSKDSTFKTVLDKYSDNNNVKVLTKENGGKASALNYGIAHANGDIIVCIDADTQLVPDAISRLISYFTDNDVVAVAGNVKVGNEHTVFTKWQAIEYITSQNFDRRAFDLLNGITVVPGAIGAFRKQAVIDIGGFTTDTLAEDCDLTMRLLRTGKKIRYCNTAIALTEAPETMKMFLKQRFRWSFGILQCVWKHRDTIFIPKYKGLGMLAMPNTLVFQFILPLLAPIADIYMVLSLLSGNWMQVLIYYGLFTVVDILAAFVAFTFENEAKTRLWWIFPQRIIYRILLSYILIKSILAALRGSLIGWGVLKRTGNVALAGNQNGK